MDVRRAFGLLGLTGLVGAMPLFLCSAPIRPPAHARPNAIALTSVARALYTTPDLRALPDVTADVPVVQAQPHPDCLVLRCVALTFDDGPGPYTTRLLGLLAAANVRATFFLIGESARDFPDQVRAEQAQGEEVGDHSWSHPQLTHLDDPQVADQFNRTADEIASLDGQRPTLIRPPYGAVDARVNSVLGDQGAPEILWSVDTLDWLHRNPDSVYERAMHDVRPGSIILMHDIHPTTVDAVPRLIDALKSQGYTLVTVSQLFGGTLEPGKLYFGREKEWTEHNQPEQTPSPDPSIAAALTE
ncbi:MAG TPA: polysaccharide deacetylase family protein [Sporichthyaceae bacterium]